MIWGCSGRKEREKKQHYCFLEMNIVVLAFPTVLLLGSPLLSFYPATTELD